MEVSFAWYAMKVLSSSAEKVAAAILSPPMEREFTVFVVSEEPTVAVRGDALVLVMTARSTGRTRFGEGMVLDGS